jgi:hypothetical protein
MAYIGVSPSNGVRRVHTYTATASQTTFSGAGAEGTSLSYKDSNFVDVYQNGIKLGDADYTSTSGTSIVLAQGASVDDLVVVVVFDVFSVADTVSKADGGTFDGAVTMAGTLGVTGATTLTGGVSGNTTFSGEIITSTSGTSNVRIGENAGDAIASGGNYNVLIGDEAGTALTTGDNNTFVGYASGDAQTVADNNTAVGYEALSTNVNGSACVAIGYRALKTQNYGSATDSFNVAIGNVAGTSITTGTLNTLVGSISGDALTTGITNVALGYGSLTSDTAGNRSTALGYNTLQNQNLSSSTDTYNTAVGFQAGISVTTGLYNTLMGGQAGDALTDADYNTYIGYSAGGADDLGSYNVAVGAGALSTLNYSGATNGQNVAVGYNALQDQTTAVQNTAVGNHAGGGVTTGSYNIFIGNAAGDHDNPTTTGGPNIVIGAYADTSAGASTHQIVMGYNVTGSGDNNFTFGNTGTDSNIAFGATSITAPSDIRLKEDIKDETVGLEFINELRPVTFRWKKAKDVPSEMKVHSDSEERVMNGKYNHGFIAQEVKSVIDKYDIKDGFGMWTEDEVDGRQRVAPSELIPMLVKAIQELSAEIKALKRE